MNRIKELREANNLSLTDLFKETGIPKSSLSEYEKGPRTPRKKETWETLAKAFDVSVPYIMGLSDEKNDLKQIKKTAELTLDKKQKEELKKTEIDWYIQNIETYTQSLITIFNNENEQFSNNIADSILNLLKTIYDLYANNKIIELESLVLIEKLFTDSSNRSGLFTEEYFKKSIEKKDGNKTRFVNTPMTSQELIEKYSLTTTELKKNLDEYFNNQVKNRFDKK